MFIVALVIAVPLLALVLAALVRDVRDDGYGSRAAARSAGDDHVLSAGAAWPIVR